MRSLSIQNFPIYLKNVRYGCLDFDKREFINKSNEIMTNQIIFKMSYYVIVVWDHNLVNSLQIMISISLLYSDIFNFTSFCI